MTRNLYSPPNAQVSDVPEATGGSRRPRSVLNALYLTAFSFVLGVPDLVRGVGPVSLSAAAITLVIVAGLMFSVWKRQTWARYVFLALFLLGLLGMLGMQEVFAAQDTFSTLAMAVESLAQLGAVICLFVPASNMWFRKA